MNLSLKDIAKKIKAVDYSSCYFNFLGKKNRWLIFIVLLMVSGISGQIWYKYVYNPGWSDEQKKAYVNSKDKGTVFNRSKFDEAVASQENRKKNYEKQIGDMQDIFRLGERDVK